MLNRFIGVLAIVALGSICAFLGFKYGFKETFNNGPDSIQYVDNDVSVQNSLSGITLKPIFGPRPPSPKPEENKANYRGFLLYKQLEKETEVRLTTQDIPISISIAEDKKAGKQGLSVDLPKSMRVELARPNPVTDTYDFKDLGIINFNPPQNSTYTGELSKSVAVTDDTSFISYDLMLFYDAEDKVQNIYEITIAGYSNIPENKRRPFFWVYIK